MTKTTLYTFSGDLLFEGSPENAERMVRDLPECIWGDADGFFLCEGRWASLSTFACLEDAIDSALRVPKMLRRPR